MICECALKILNHFNSSYKYGREKNIKNNKNDIFRYIFKQCEMSFQLNTDTCNNRPPINPFKKIMFCHSHIFNCYLNILLGSYNKYYSNYNRTFIGIWFGDQIHTLTLMQHSLFKMMESNKFSNESYLCPQLK